MGWCGSDDSVICSVDFADFFYFFPPFFLSSFVFGYLWSICVSSGDDGFILMLIPGVGWFVPIYSISGVWVL